MDQRAALDSLRIDRGPSKDAGGARRMADRRRGPPAWTWVLGGLLLVGASVGGWWVLNSRPPLVQVVTVTIPKTGAEAGAVLNASGYVTARQRATVAAQVTGMVVDVYVQEGDQVAAGQILARLDDSAARASRDAAASQIEATRAIVRQHQAEVVKGERDFARTRALHEQGFASPSSLDAALASIEVSRANVARAASQVQAAQKALEVSDTLLSYTVIRAPFSGVVTNRYARPGEMISPQAVGGFTQTGICTLVDMSSLELEVDIGESYINRVRSGQAVDAVLDAYPDWRIPGRVITVVPTANQQKGTVKVRIGIEERDPRILPQMAVQVWFKSEARPGAPTATPAASIPQTALISTGDGTYAQVIEDGRVRLKRIRTEAATGDQVRVIAGVGQGDRIVSPAQPGLEDGERVRQQ